DCGDVLNKMYGSLTEFVNKEVQRHAEEPPWQPPPVLSSFDNSCPLLDRFQIFIGRRTCEIVCQEGDRPLSDDKLRRHGIDVSALGHCVLQIVATLARCDPNALSIAVDSALSSTGSLELSFSQPPMGDPRFRGVGAKILQGNVRVSIFGPADGA